ncbi:MAG: hypothetical protein KKG64_05650 [Firmicutes bacterium]|nr:hypothetical protein [Bacillota bacterium]
MTKYEVLNQLDNQEIKSDEAYRLLYSTTKERKPRRAGFVKIRIKIPESKGATIFLSILLFVPIPLFLVKLFIPRRFKQIDENVSDKIPISPQELIKLSSLKGVKIDVKSSDGVKVLIQTI